MRIQKGNQTKIVCLISLIGGHSGWLFDYKMHSPWNAVECEAYLTLWWMELMKGIKDSLCGVISPKAVIGDRLVLFPHTKTNQFHIFFISFSFSSPPITRLNTPVVTSHQRSSTNDCTYYHIQVDSTQHRSFTASNKNTDTASTIDRRPLLMAI